MDQDTTQRLKLDLVQMDHKLKTKQPFWETPYHFGVMLGITVIMTSALFGWIGYGIGSTPPVPPAVIVIQLQQPPSR